MKNNDFKNLEQILRKREQKPIKERVGDFLSTNKNDLVFGSLFTLVIGFVSYFAYDSIKELLNLKPVTDYVDYINSFMNVLEKTNSLSMEINNLENIVVGAKETFFNPQLNDSYSQETSNILNYVNDNYNILNADFDSKMKFLTDLKSQISESFQYNYLRFQIGISGLLMGWNAGILGKSIFRIGKNEKHKKAQFETSIKKIKLIEDHYKESPNKEYILKIYEKLLDSGESVDNLLFFSKDYSELGKYFNLSKKSESSGDFYKLLSEQDNLTIGNAENFFKKRSEALGETMCSYGSRKYRYVGGIDLETYQKRHDNLFLNLFQRGWKPELIKDSIVALSNYSLNQESYNYFYTKLFDLEEEEVKHFCETIKKYQIEEGKFKSHTALKHIARNYFNEPFYES